MREVTGADADGDRFLGYSFLGPNAQVVTDNDGHGGFMLDRVLGHAIRNWYRKFRAPLAHPALIGQADKEHAVQAIIAKTPRDDEVSTSGMVEADDDTDDLSEEQLYLPCAETGKLMPVVFPKDEVLRSAPIKSEYRASVCWLFPSDEPPPSVVVVPVAKGERNLMEFESPQSANDAEALVAAQSFWQSILFQREMEDTRLRCFVPGFGLLLPPRCKGGILWNQQMAAQWGGIPQCRRRRRSSHRERGDWSSTWVRGPASPCHECPPLHRCALFGPLHAMDPVPMAGFVHLDDYTGEVRTTVARPALEPPRRGVQLVNVAMPEWERWPPARVPLSYWGVRSVLAQHCAWLLVNLPMEYVKRYRELTGDRLPAVGHLHFLYDNRGYHQSLGSCGAPDIGRIGPVDLPPDLCLCDCPVNEAEGDHNSVLTLVSRCITEAFVWTQVTTDQLQSRLPGVSASEPERWGRAVIGCCHLSGHATEGMASGLRDPSSHPEWLPAVMECLGVAADIDAVILQCAYLWSPSGEGWVPEAAVALWLACSAGSGPVSAWVPQGTRVLPRWLSPSSGERLRCRSGRITTLGRGTRGMRRG